MTGGEIRISCFDRETARSVPWNRVVDDEVVGRAVVVRADVRESDHLACCLLSRREEPLKVHGLVRPDGEEADARETESRHHQYEAECFGHLSRRSSGRAEHMIRVGAHADAR